jgi:hypothetical protein
MVYLGYPLGFPRFFRIESPRISMRCAFVDQRRLIDFVELGRLCAVSSRYRF